MISEIAHGNKHLAHAVPGFEAFFGERLVLRARAAVHERVDGNAAASRELANDLHVLRLQKTREVVVDHVHHVLVEVAVAAESEEVELERLRLDEKPRRDVAYRERGEVGLACLRT